MNVYHTTELLISKYKFDLQCDYIVIICYMFFFCPIGYFFSTGKIDNVSRKQDKYDQTILANEKWIIP